jgi:hypothetical protein
MQNPVEMERDVRRRSLFLLASPHSDPFVGHATAHLNHLRDLPIVPEHDNGAKFRTLVQEVQVTCTQYPQRNSQEYA